MGGIIPPNTMHYSPRGAIIWVKRKLEASFQPARFIRLRALVPCFGHNHKRIIRRAHLRCMYYLNMGKDIVTIYSTMPPEEALPVIVTTIAVSTLKVGAITGVMLLIK